MKQARQGDKPILLSRTWAEIDLGAVRDNAVVLQRLAEQGNEPMAIVKANAYGHGAGPVARACEVAGIRHFGVASVDEGYELRNEGIEGDIYVLSSTLPEDADELVRFSLIPFVSSLDQWMALDQAASTLRIAMRRAQKSPPPLPRCVLVLDSGMGREGCYFDEARKIYERCRSDWHERGTGRLVGIATHFSSADEPGWGDAVTEEQGARYFTTLRELDALAPLADFTDERCENGVWLTLANSPGTLRWSAPEVAELPAGIRGFLERDGLLTYGIEPYRGAYNSSLGLRPVLSWRARVTLVRDLPAGATVGYGQTHTLTRPSRIATLAVGYADGLSRNLSNRGVITLHGARSKIVGRVSMDQCQVDVTDIGDRVTVGDVATLIGSDGDETLTTLQMAETSETTPHEPTCRLTARVPRIYLGGDGG